MSTTDYSLVNAVAALGTACVNFDWRGVIAVIGEAHEQGARVTASRSGNVVSLRVAAANCDAVRSVIGLHAKDADAILASLAYTGAEVMQ